MLGRLKSILYKTHLNEHLCETLPGHPVFSLETKNYIYHIIGTTSPKDEFDCFPTPKFNESSVWHQYFGAKGYVEQKTNRIFKISEWHTLDEIKEKQFKEYMFDYILKHPEHFKYFNLNNKNFEPMDKEFLMNLWYETYINFINN